MSTTLSTNTPALSRGARFMRFPLVRILLAAFALVLTAALTYAAAKAIAPKPARIMWPHLLATATVLLTYIAWVRRVERRKVTEFARGGALRELGAGCAIGAALVVAVVGVLYLGGFYHPGVVNPWSLAIVAPIAEMIFAGVFEELLFRGVVFRITEQALGSTVALLVSAVLFGLAHIGEQGVGALAAVVTVLAGAMFAAAYMLTRRLWLCIGIHAAWNYTLGSIFSIAVSSHASRGLVDATLTGPDWITGGAYGLEASVVTLAVIGITGALILWKAKRKG